MPALVLLHSLGDVLYDHTRNSIIRYMSYQCSQGITFGDLVTDTSPLCFAGPVRRATHLGHCVLQPCPFQCNWIFLALGNRRCRRNFLELGIKKELKEYLFYNTSLSFKTSCFAEIVEKEMTRTIENAKYSRREQRLENLRRATFKWPFLQFRFSMKKQIGKVTETQDFLGVAITAFNMVHEASM
ncbi:hypothetical protein VNO77_29267 [Canavalia gladiata]|uniref:Uncharacterized protein n=1 Tax=Canavalia gladiata TaxID=3824 RepID=A0AAN9L039_CANGL